MTYNMPYEHSVHIPEFLTASILSQVFYFWGIVYSVQIQDALFLHGRNNQWFIVTESFKFSLSMDTFTQKCLNYSLLYKHD